MLEVSQYLTSNYTTEPYNKNSMVWVQKSDMETNVIEDPEINP
jgi:hypothetical protein